jgi:exosortase
MADFPKRLSIFSYPLEAANRRTGWCQALILAGVMGLVYADILVRLGKQWWTDDNYSHGLVVPLFSAFLLWKARKKLSGLPLAPSWTGLLIMAGALLVLIVGVLGAEFFLSRTSLIFLLGGLVIYLCGWRHFRVVLFPWAFLFLMVPLPAIVFNEIAFPLQLLASRFASVLLELTGVPVLREGNLIRLPTMTLEVVEACSGIRSLISLTTLAIIYGYFMDRSVLRRVCLAVGAIPIAVFANGLRVTGTGLLGQYWDPDKAQGFFHTFQGWVIFVLSLGCLWGLHGVMGLADRWHRASKCA